MAAPSSGGPRISIVAAMDRHRLIGVKGERMPWHLPDDLRHFKRTTLGKPVIMGRRTHASIGRTLPGRLNIVLTRGDGFASIDGQLVIATTLDQAIGLASEWLAEHRSAGAAAAADEVCVIGGAEVYAQAISATDRLYLTEIDAAFEGDNHFPAFREMQPGWTELHRETHRAPSPNDFDYAFVTYDRER